MAEMGQRDITVQHRSKSTSGPLAAATRRSGLDALALAHLHSRLIVHGGRSHALLDLPCHRQEGLLHIRSVLGRGLEEGDSEAVGELLSGRKR